METSRDIKASAGQTKKAMISELRCLVSVVEMPHIGKYHSDTSLVGGGNDLVVAH